MTTSKTLTAAVAAAAMVGVIGLAYAQTSSDGPGQSTQDPNRAAAMGTNSDTNLGKTPATTTGTMPATTQMGSDNRTGSTMTNPSTGTDANRNAGMSGTDANGNMNSTMAERTARTDRN